MKNLVPLYKQAQQSRRRAYAAILKVASAIAGNEVKAPGLLRQKASAAWRMGVSVPRPKTTKPTTQSGSRAKDSPTAKPPSKTAYYSDIIQSLNDPKRGFRQTKPES